MNLSNRFEWPSLRLQQNLALLVLLPLALMLSGCSVKLAYNNADRLVRWGVSDYVDFTAEQRTYFDDQLAVVLYWHRSTQLPLYAVGLTDLNRAILEGVDQAYMESFTLRVENWADDLQDQMLPMASQMLMSLTDEQIAQLPARFAAANDEWVEDEWGKTVDEAQKNWQEGFSDGFRRFTGRLNKQQNEYLAQAVVAYQPEAEAWLAYRERWQIALLNLLATRDQTVQFETKFFALSKNRESFYGDYAPIDESNQALATSIVRWLLTNLTPAQQKKFDNRMRSLIEDFEELAADLPRIAPVPAKCLVTVPTCP